MDGTRMIPLLPVEFLTRIGTQLGNELPRFLEAMHEAPIRGIRMNPEKNRDGQPFRDAENKIPWERNGWELKEDSAAGITVAHEAGAFYLQDPCAMLPAAVLNARPGERILDLCSAPGGKATQMGLDMQGEGLLVCNEPVPKRAAILSRNIERMGIPHTIVTCAYPEKLADAWEEGFDGVLADVPCSGEGMFRKNPLSRSEWTAEKAEGCTGRQRKILDAAARLVRPGGRLVYSTCSWNPAENDQMISGFLETHPEFTPEPFRMEGIGAENGMFLCWPHLLRGEGQFVAKLRRADGERKTLSENRKAFAVKKDDLLLWEQSGIRTPKPNALFRNTLVRADFIPELKGIQVIRLGLHIGEIRGKQMIPDHAAAMNIHRTENQEISLTDEEALRYMAGEAIPGAAKGWTLLTWHGLALGWGKGSDGMIKNHYPKGLRNNKLII